MLNVKRTNNDYSALNDKSLCGHCTNERRVRKRDKKR